MSESKSYNARRAPIEAPSVQASLKHCLLPLMFERLLSIPYIASRSTGPLQANVDQSC